MSMPYNDDNDRDICDSFEPCETCIANGVESIDHCNTCGENRDDHEGGDNMPSTDTRTCTVCDQVLPATTEFFRQQSTNAARLRRQCRSCERARRGSGTGTGTRRSARDNGRIFGVELELLGPSAYDIITALVNAGVPMTARNRSTMSEIGYGNTNTERNEWTLKHDGSVGGYGLELVSPKLRGDRGFAVLRKVCEVLNAIGATVNTTCGLHVHHDFRGLQVESVLRQVRTFVEREDLVLELVAPSRRANSTYVPRWDAGHLDRLNRVTSLSQFPSCGPRGTLNPWAYGDHGSVEIRAHAGTTQYKKIAAWVRFGQAIFAAGEARVTLPTDTPENLLTALTAHGLTSEDAAILLRFRHAGSSRSEVQARIEQLQSVLEEV